MSDPNYQFPIRPAPSSGGSALSFTEQSTPPTASTRGRECTQAERHAQLQTLVQQFNANNAYSTRRQLFGGATAGILAVQAHNTLIADVTRELSARSPAVFVDARLLQSILYVENDFNGGGLGGRTTLPMNVSYDAWQPLLARNNITREGLNDPRTNIMAAALIIHNLDNRTPCDITDPHERRAIVASLYGNTGITRSVQRPIMYGAMVADVYQQGTFVNPAQPLIAETLPTRACRANEVITPPPAWCALQQPLRSTRER